MDEKRKRGRPRKRPTYGMTIRIDSEMNERLQKISDKSGFAKTTIAKMLVCKGLYIDTIPLAFVRNALS